MLHYGGGAGQRSWLLHRVTGLGILLYLFAHITDTFFVVVNPAWYDHAMKLYGGEIGEAYYWPLRWGFRLGELALIACVLFHSINGLRIVLFDFWPRAAQYQDRLYRVVIILFWGIMIPVAVWVVLPLFSAPVGRAGQNPAPAPGAIRAERAAAPRLGYAGSRRSALERTV
jgi:succinate dehydrogenase / fumarate reductase cytochrome b subunit